VYAVFSPYYNLNLDKMDLHKHISSYYDRSTWKFIAYIVAIFIISIAVLIPWYPDFIQTASGDAAYTYIYHELFSGEASCGNDLYCSHGPLGIWYWTIYHPDTFWMLIVLHIYVALAIVASASSIALSKIGTYVFRALFILIIIGLLSIDLDARIFLVNILFFIFLPQYFNKRESSLLFILLLSVIAFSFYVKSTFMIFGFVSIIGASIIEISLYRRIPRIFLWYVLFLTIFSFISGMDVMSIPQHIVRTFDFARGYTDIFSEYGNYYDLIIFIILSLVFGILVIIKEKKVLLPVGWVYIVCYAALTFLIYKASFTRLDGMHVLHGYVSIITSILLYTISNFSVGGIVARYKLIFFTIATLIAIGLLSFLYKNPSIYQGKFQKLHTNIVTAGGVILGNDKLDVLHNKAKKKIVDSYPIKSIDGSVTLLDERQTIGIANNLNLKFIPTVVESIAVNSEAKLLNSRLFNTYNSPDYLLIPDRVVYPGQTILEIIKNYTFDKYNNIFVQLKNTPNSKKNIVFSKNKEFKINIDELFYVDNISNLLWINIEVNKTVLGKLTELLYKIPRLYIEVEKLDGSTDVINVSPNLLKSGFILSYVGESMYDIFNKDRYSADNPVKGFTLKSTGESTLFFDQDITLSIATIDILSAID